MKIKNKDLNNRGQPVSPVQIGKILADYLLYGENPLAIAYRRRKGQEVCGTVINSKFISYGI